MMPQSLTPAARSSDGCSDAAQGPILCSLAVVAVELVLHDGKLKSCRGTRCRPGLFAFLWSATIAFFPVAAGMEAPSTASSRLNSSLTRNLMYRPPHLLMASGHALVVVRASLAMPAPPGRTAACCTTNKLEARWRGLRRLPKAGQPLIPGIFDVGVVS